MTEAPLYSDVAEAPSGGRAVWIETADGVRLRIGLWRQGAAGTIIVLPGRTEFIEKYGRTAAEFRKLGYATATIDWRGQGLSDRLFPNRQLGYVETFDDYQTDLSAFLDALSEQDAPKPWYMVAHSMGGTIGLRALHNNIAVERAVFTSPMWGIFEDPLLKPIAHAFAAGSKTVGMGSEYAPGTGPENYIQRNGFEGNTLTGSPEVFAYLERQIAVHPGLAIGGPSLNWLHAALAETKALMKLPVPDYPVMCLLGSSEKVVDGSAVIGYMEGWPAASFHIINGAMHEVLMETQIIQSQTYTLIEDFLRA